MYNMYKMIRKQPDAIRYTLEHCTKQATGIRSLLDSRRIYLTGCGSSFHAAIYGEYVLRANGFDAFAVHVLDILHYAPKLKDSVVIVLSHSWKTKTTLKAVRMLLQNNVKCIAITANEAVRRPQTIMRSSKQFDESDCVTMGYTTELAALALLARPTDKQLHNIPAMIDNVIDREFHVEQLADTYYTKKRFFVIGAGPNVATGYEAALKMKEGNFTDAEGMQVEQLLHGSISGVDPDDVVFLIAPRTAKSFERIGDVARALKEIDTSTIAITDSDKMTKLCNHVIKIPLSAEHHNPMLSIVPLQLFAYHLAVRNKINPDMTREDDVRYRRAYSLLRLHYK